MKQTTIRWHKQFAAIIIVFASTLAHAQSSCAPGDAVRAALLPLALQQKLLTHKLTGDDFELDAPPDVSRDIVMLRKTLDVATQAFFRCEAGDDTNPTSLQQKLSAFLHTDQSKRNNNGNAVDGIYGANLQIQIIPAKAFPNSLFVVLNFGIECGDDNLLFLYTQEDGQWCQRLHWYSDKYTKPSDAFGDIYYYSAVPGPAADQPLLVVAHGHPWCTSGYSSFDLDLIQPATAASPQQHLDHAADDYIRTFDTRFSRTANGLELRVHVASRDSDLIFQPGILRYSTNTGKFILLPVALNARDFVNQWLEEPWSTVAGWSATPVQNLQNTHNRFDYSLHKGGDDIPGVTFGAVRSCTSAPNHFQIEIDLTDSKSNSIPPLYAQIRQNPGSFTMLAVTPKADPTCTGPNLMPKH